MRDEDPDDEEPYESDETESDRDSDFNLEVAQKEGTVEDLESEEDFEEDPLLEALVTLKP